MKLLQYTVIAIAILLIAGLIYKSSNYKKPEQTYASVNKSDYKESEINKLKRELDDIRIEKMRIQAKLDSCKYFTEPCPEVTKPKSKGTPKTKTYKVQFDSTLQLLNQKRLDCADLEIKLTDELNLRRRQLDTCAYFVQEFDKALINQGNELTKLTNERDSLKTVLSTPISKQFDLPCIKTRKGLKVTAFLNPERELSVVTRNLNKKEFKVVKKQCKKVQSH